MSLSLTVNPWSASSQAPREPGSWKLKPARSKGASNVPGSKQGVRKAVICQKANKEPGSKQETRLLGSQQETRLLGSQQETRLLGSQQGIREPARHQKGSNELESQQ